MTQVLSEVECVPADKKFVFYWTWPEVINKKIFRFFVYISKNNWDDEKIKKDSDEHKICRQKVQRVL